MEKRIYINNLETPFWIDTNGRLRNENTKRYLKGSINKGYHFFNVYFKGKQHLFYTHRLVAEMFLPNPDNLPIVHHKDGNKLNNNLYNLEWIDNQEHSKMHKDDKKVSVKRTPIEIDVDIDSLKQYKTTPYYISEEGEVYNLDKMIHIKLEKSGNYYRFSCNYNNTRKHVSVHRAVWEAFNGEIPEGYEINHIDGNGRNNNLNNLELVTHSDNCKKANHGNKKIYGVNIETEEKIYFTSMTEAGRYFFDKPGKATQIRNIIEKQISINGYLLYFDS